MSEEGREARRGGRGEERRAQAGDDVSISYHRLLDPSQPQGGSTQALQQGQGVKKCKKGGGGLGEKGLS